MAAAKRLVPGEPILKLPWLTAVNAFEDRYLVDSASSHMLVSKIKPCMSKYKQFIQRNCEWLIKSVIVYLIVPHYLDNRGNSRANTCAKARLTKGCIY
jgi:hypothetical protein